MTTITKPGLYDLEAADYHSDPVPEGSLSQSRAKVLLDEGGPAIFHHKENSPRVEKKEFDEGTVIHALILGKGMERIEVLDFPNYTTKAAREARDAAYAKGLTPLLTKDMARAQKVADSIPDHIRQLFTGGEAEVSMFWRHTSGLWLRGQMDYYVAGGRIVDLKTMNDTSNRGLSRAVWNLRYYMQAAWYRRGVEAITGERLPYLIVGIEKTAPYLTRAVELTDDYLAVGEAHMDDAIATYLTCVETGHWPGHPDRTQRLGPPPWVRDDIAADTITALEELIEGAA
ncbi:PD-(D/E)XK nuclease-like domain-containing protein [Ruania suaedae]|uniref:PD-(D/E)XK nuclease-like domain-containing protein n=1 Tax=Ruania suaedae TaxID=2897774 RepID=UPI001E63B768|nr:PD-(D/E)XK nuclease-like domain-containing protein [Ruania suaedae]UFU03462.1 PD-(D/E)XK nuclease-like domain-containing protein [Ruania suaedae]